MGGAASTSVDGDGDKLRAILVCHSSQENVLRGALARAGIDHEIVIITDSYPHDRQQRANLLSRVHAAFIAVESSLQQSSELIETVSYLKDQRKTVISGPLTFYSIPSGAIGAICLALGQWDPLLFATPDRIEHWATQYELLRNSEDSQENAFQVTTENELAADANANASSQIFFVYCKDDGGESDQIVDLFAHNRRVPGDVFLSGEVSICQHDLTNDLAALGTASVVVFIITEACTTDDDAAKRFRQLFELALSWNKPLLPIKEQRASLHGWLGLAMAGRLWYQVDANALELVSTPYADIPNCPCKVKDSCLATDFVLCANGLLSTPQRTLEHSQIASREGAALQIFKERAQVLGLPVDEVSSICSRVEELIGGSSASDLHDLLGIATTHEAVEVEATQPQSHPEPKGLLPDEESESTSPQPLADIHYDVTRTGFKPPPAVLDTDGLPVVGLQLDAMFSYQWGSQQKVLDIHQQGQVHSLRAWFDVYGHMQGNVNSAMAAAVESVACMVVFLTKAYLGSVNCRLEFEYAARCRKPMIFAFLEDPETLELPAWVVAVAGTDSFNVYPNLIRESSENQSQVLALDMNAHRVHGVPTTAVLLGAIRRLAAWRSQSPLPIVYDGSLRLYATTSALHHALTGAETSNADDETASRSMSTLCTRCGAPYSLDVPASLEGCRRHSGYYLGGSLIAGRWVCCQETDKNGPGCQPSQHMSEDRTWTTDPSYGTHTYEPNP